MFMGQGLGERRGTNGKQLDRVKGLHRGDGIAGIYGTLKSVRRNDVGNVGQHADIQAGRDPRQHIAAHAAGVGNDVRIPLGHQ
ncbi:hypothetical protein D3C76_1450660 [compost metagenome]